MAAPNYQQVLAFSNTTAQLAEAAVDEFESEIWDGITFDEAMEIAKRIAEKFAFFGAELGAQWYDFCSEVAGVNVPPAELYPLEAEDIATSAEAYKQDAQGKTPSQVFDEFLTEQIAKSRQATESANLHRDYNRGRVPGRWARVPVGETCAWCLMLASQGAWYLSRESALREEAGKYHKRCDCKAVYHADPDDIAGYQGDLDDYKRMYYDADNRRQAAKSGRDPYPDDLAKRIKIGHEIHEAREDRKEQEARERGEDYKRKPWTVYNEDLIIMRYYNDLK